MAALLRNAAAAGRKGDAGRDAAAARARSFRCDLAPVLAAIAAEAGGTPEGIAASLTRRGVEKPRGGRVWTPPDVRRLLSRLATDTRAGRLPPALASEARDGEASLHTPERSRTPHCESDPTGSPEAINRISHEAESREAAS